MITAQDIREKTFEKSKFGGYDMAEVDEFLEEIADDLTASQKEISTLKAKMKILVEKIEEYRNNETALNQSILSAQKLAVQIESDAESKAEKLLADARAKADAVIGGISEQADFEEKRLDDAKAASAKFFDGIRAMCNAQLRNLDSISAKVLGVKEKQPEAPVEEAPAPRPVRQESPRPAPEVEAPKAPAPRPARKESPKPAPAAEAKKEKEEKSVKEFDDGISSIEAAVRSIEDSVSKIKPEAPVKIDLSNDMDDLHAKFKDFDSTQPFSL